MSHRTKGGSGALSSQSPHAPHAPDSTCKTIPGGVLAMRGYGAARVYAALAIHGAGARYVPISVVDLAGAAGVHRNTARAALRRLAGAGFASEKPARAGYWRIYLAPVAPVTPASAIENESEG